MPKLLEKSIIVMDNATFHKSPIMQQTLERKRHCLLYLPPYSTDFNPIEHKWVQAKALKKMFN